MNVKSLGGPTLGKTVNKCNSRICQCLLISCKSPAAAAAAAERQAVKRTTADNATSRTSEKKRTMKGSIVELLEAIKPLKPEWVQVH